MSDVPDDLRRKFWSLVVLFNVALLAPSVGAMLVAFRGQWLLGAGLVFVGAVAGGRGLHGYRRARAVDGDDDND